MIFIQVMLIAAIIESDDRQIDYCLTRNTDYTVINKVLEDLLQITSTTVYEKVSHL